MRSTFFSCTARAPVVLLPLALLLLMGRAFASPKAPPAEDRAPQGLVPEGVAMRMVGVRAGPLRTEETNSAAASVVAYEYADALFRAGLWSARYADRAWLGYDGRGFTYEFALNGSLGVLLPLGLHHGAVMRAAVRSEAMQLSGLNFTQIAVPGAELGYSYLKGPTQLELVGLIGPSLAGELRRGDQRVDLSGILWGAAMTIRWQALSFTLDAAFTELPDSQRTMRGVAHLCGILGPLKGPPARKPGSDDSLLTRTAEDSRRVRAALCADLSSVQLWSPRADADGPSATSLGLSLLFGNISRLYTLDSSGL